MASSSVLMPMQGKLKLELVGPKEEVEAAEEAVEVEVVAVEEAEEGEEVFKNH